MTTPDVHVASTHDPGRLLRFKTAASRKGLGSTRVSLEEARKRVLGDKIDPLEARRAERAKQAALGARNKTFSQVMLEY